MIELTNLLNQTLAAGQAVTFDKIIHQSKCGTECFSSQLPTSVKLRGGCGATYLVEFSANIASPTAGAAMQLAIAVGNQPLFEAKMNRTPSTANTFDNVGTGTYVVLNCADLDRVSVVNSGGVPVILGQGSNLRIRRVA